MSLFAELKRRNVIRVAVTYLVAAWVLVQVMELATDAFAAPAWVLKIFIVLLAVGFVPAVIFSWVYELTPDGLKRESEVAPEESVTAHTAKRLNIAVIVLLGAVVVLYAVDRTRLQQPGPATAAQLAPLSDATAIDSIAVLPFEDFSPQGDQAHLARGIADTILHMLAQADGLRVAARTSSFMYQGTSTPIDRIASELGVGAVLEGSVQRFGNRLRIIAQLIRASDQTHLWSQTFDRNADDVFAIQDEIAQAVVAALRPGSEAGVEAPVSTRTNVAAYEHYLRGKEALQQRTATSVEFALEQLQTAVELDPGFVPAWIQLGFTYMALNAVTPRTWSEIEGPAEESFRKAVELAPNDPEALSGLGSFIANSGYDPFDGRPYLEQVLSLSPNNATALLAIANLDLFEGQVEAASQMLLRAYELDPNNPRTAIQYGGLLAQLGRYDRARAVAERLLIQRPDSPAGHALLRHMETSRGRYDLAIKHALDELRVNPDSYASYHQLADLYATLDDQDRAMAWYQKTPEPVQTQDYIPDILFMTRDGLPRLLASAERDLVLYPGWDGGQRRYIETLFLNGLVEQAVEAAERYEEVFLTAALRLDAAMAGTMARRAGKQELGERLIKLTRERIPALRDAGVTIEVHAGEAILAIAEGDADAAFRSLDEYLAAGGLHQRFFRLHPVFNPLRDDPRFKAFMANMKSTADEQLARLREVDP